MKGALGKIDWAPSDAKVHNPAFDVTPATFISKYILNTGNLSKDQLVELTSEKVPSPPLAPAFEDVKKNTPSLKAAAQPVAPNDLDNDFAIKKDGTYMGF